MDKEILADKRWEYQKLLDYSAREIVARLSCLNVHKISLFGSYARGRTDLFTDLDVLVIMDTDKPFTERITEIYSLLALPVDADILCYTPQEFQRMKETPFLKKALTDEVVLYEKTTT
ncbi:MAG: nucleotidyltransferase domain-containing protein [Dehalococcoidia bacterium]